MGVLVSFPIAVLKHQDKSNVRAHSEMFQAFMVGKSRQHKLKATGHIVSTVRKAVKG